MIKFSDILNERIAMKHSFDDYLKLVSNAYIKATKYDSTVVHHWKALNQADYNLFKRLQSKIKVDFVNGEPYNNAQEMSNDVKQNKHLSISKDNNEHPIFSPQDNLVFRAVHDYFAHVIVGAPFGGRGEIKAYNTHCKLFPKEAVPALFTEVVGQASVAVTTGNFPEQKIALLHGFDYWNIGILTPELEKQKHAEMY